MEDIQNASDRVPQRDDVARLALEASRRADAMGLLEHGVVRTDVATIRQLANRVRRAGIAVSTADVLNNVESPSAGELAALLGTMIAALEASPAPRFEWRGVGRVFSAEDLAPLLNVSVSSLKRYQSGERDT